MNTQKKRLIDYLEAGNSITSLQAWQQLGIARLASRINEIQKIIPIDRKMVKVRNRFGESVSVMRYWKGEGNE